MKKSLVQLVWRRAEAKCEYCQVPQAIATFAFQIDHVIARKHDGPTSAENLALSCLDCNVCKGSDVSGVDPISGAIVRLFNPRSDQWAEHFEWRNFELYGKTDIGRVTVKLLQINNSERVDLRSQIAEEETD
jgi:hypothetical protein